MMREEHGMDGGEKKTHARLSRIHAPFLSLSLNSKPEEQVDLAAAAAAGVPVIRRFSGGGSVVVDGGTLLVGLAGPAAAVLGAREAAAPADSPALLGPRALMAWTEGVYGPVFRGIGPFALRENGERWERGERERRKKTPRARFALSSPPPLYLTLIFFLRTLIFRLRLRRPEVRGQRPGHLKGAVGAPHVRSFFPAKKRPQARAPVGVGALWRKRRPLFQRVFSSSSSSSFPSLIPHSSFLWDYTPSRMALLTHPARAPAYRAGRPHAGFVTTLKAEVEKTQATATITRRGLLAALPGALEGVGFRVVPTTLEEAEAELVKDHHRTTRVLVDGSGAVCEKK